LAGIFSDVGSVKINIIGKTVYLWEDCHLKIL